MSDENKKGFSGLGGLISDVKLNDVESKETPSAAPPPPPENPPEQEAPKIYKDTSTPGTGVKKFWWIVGGLLFLWLIAQEDTGKNSSNSPSQSSYSSYSNDASSSSTAEEKPPVGSSLVLDRAQIRYCLSEKARMDAAEPLVNHYSDNEVTLFNQMVSDYNSRCGSYRYRPGSLEAVRAEVAANQVNLVTEAQNRIKGWRSSEVAATDTEQSPTAPETATSILSPDLYLGKYKYEYSDANYSESSTLSISKASVNQSGQETYKISIHLASPYCSGDIEAYGYPVRDVFGFVSNDNPGCVLAAKLDQSSSVLEVAEVKDCAKWHGARCTFTGKYARSHETDQPVPDAAQSTPQISPVDVPKKASEVEDVDALPDPVLAKAVAEVAGQLPMKMEDMTLETVKAEGKKTMVYMYRLTGDAKNFDATEAGENISQHWCKSSEVADFRKINAVILYRYFDSSGAPVQEIKVRTQDCK